MTVSDKFQVVIPKEVREGLRIRKGQKMQVVAVGDIIQLVPDRDIRELKGFLKGMSPDGVREEKD